MFAVPILLFGVLSWTKPSWRIFWMTTEHVHPPDKSSGITYTWPKEQIQKKMFHHPKRKMLYSTLIRLWKRLARRAFSDEKSCNKLLDTVIRVNFSDNKREVSQWTFLFCL